MTESESTLHDRSDIWAKFLRSRCKDQLAKLSRLYPYERSLIIDYREIEKFGKTGLELADEILEAPGKVLEDVGDAIKNNSLIRIKDNKEPKGINIRFINLPKKSPIRNLRSDDINRFISIEGILRKSTEVRPRIVEAVFKCPAGHFTKKIQAYGKFIEPDGCATDGCTFKKLELVPKRSTFTDSQKLRVQESPEGLRGGEQPQSLDIDVTDDLCGIVAPGDRVIVNGILRSVQRIVKGEKNTVFDIFLECNSIEIGEKEFEEVEIDEKAEDEIKRLAKDPMIYRMFTHSIAQTIYGNEDVKEAIALQLFGGIAKDMPDGSRLRGDIHMLLIGDPSVAKSQMIRQVIKVCPRAVYTSGQSTTAAGLTATAVKDEFGDGRWSLEAGALVLADMGVAVVDEMDKMEKGDRSSLHEAMEQQSVSIAKAGIVATLKTRCALLGAANPKYGRFDMCGDISDQINMPPSLLSRFDLIFIMTDQPEAKRDLAIAEHIVKTHGVGELIAQHKKNPIPGVTQEYIDQQLKPVMPEIDPALFRKYVAYSKRTCFPIMSDEAKEALVGYYLKLRGLAGQDKPVPATARQLEALVRLAEASARVRLADKIDLSDAERVIRIVDVCLRQIAYDPKTGTFDIDKVATGLPKTKVDTMKAVLEIIKTSPTDPANKPRCSLELLKAKGTERGIPEDKLIEALDKLMRAREIFEPRDKQYEVV